MGEPECLSAATAILETPCKAAFVHFQPPKNLQGSNWPDASRSSPFSLATDSPRCPPPIGLHARVPAPRSRVRLAPPLAVAKMEVVIGSRFESNCIQLLFFFFLSLFCLRKMEAGGVALLTQAALTAD